MSRRVMVLAFAVSACILSEPFAYALGEKPNDGPFIDIHASDSGLHAGNDADPREIGLPVYPGAHLKRDEKQDKDAANLALFTSAFGLKLLVVNYTSDDSPDKIISFYRDKLKKYGKVIECHTKDSDPHVNAHMNDDSGKSNELKCDADDTGNNIELKAGTEDNQHAVAIQPNKSGNGVTFALVYVHVRGKQADI
jgi:hypothetical protein